jgi:hypothetical protein
MLRELSMRNLSLQNKQLTKHSTFKFYDINGKTNSALISPFRGASFNNSGQIKEVKYLKTESHPIFLGSVIVETGILHFI